MFVRGRMTMRKNMRTCLAGLLVALLLLMPLEVGITKVSAAIDDTLVRDKITSNYGEEGEQFGSAVATFGDIIAVSTNVGVFDEEGNVYLYDVSAGMGSRFEVNESETRLYASDGAINNKYGSSITMNDETLVIGAPSANGNVDGSGAVYIYDLTVDDIRGSERKLYASDGENRDEYGY